MSGIEIVVLIGAGIYITKKVKENKARKRLAREAALAAEHGTATEIQDVSEVTQHPRYRNRTPPEEEETLPLYMAPSGKPPADDEEEGDETTDTKWSNEIHLPSYDELPGGPPDADALSTTSSSHASSSTSSPIASPVPTTFPVPTTSSSHLSPDSAAKKHHHRFFKRSNRSKSELPQEL